MARFTPFTWSYTASTPQKHPPANTAVSSVAPLATCASNEGAPTGPSVEREAPLVSFAANRTNATVRTASMAAKLGRERLILFLGGGHVLDHKMPVFVPIIHSKNHGATGVWAELPVYISVSDNTFPSGSLNHATLAPLGELQTPSWSCSIPGNRSNFTPLR